MSRRAMLIGYRFTDWIKFAIPAFTSSIALALCLYLVIDCRSSIYVANDWLGLFSYAHKEDSCTLYRNDNTLVLPKSSQHLVAQVASLVVILLGFPLWLSLVLSPFWKGFHGVWPKLITISLSLVLGNLQLLAVVKFIRYVLKTYPEQKVYYENKGVVISSICFWILTGIAISLCGVKPAHNNLVANQQGSSTSKLVTHNPLSKSASEDTKDTKDLEAGPAELGNSASEETTNELEDGIIKIYSSSSEENHDIQQSIEISFSESGELGSASF